MCSVEQGVKTRDATLLQSNSNSTPKPLIAPVVAGIIMLISGAVNVQMVVVSNKQYLQPCLNCEARYYEAPIWQTFIVHSSALLLLPLYTADCYSTAVKCVTQPLGLSYSDSSEFPRCPKYLWSIPSVLDVIATVCAHMALIFINAPTARMLMALNILLTAALRRFWLHRLPTSYEAIGVTMVTVGMILAALSALLEVNHKNNYYGREWMGVFMALMTAVFSSMHFISQEHLFSHYNASVLEGAVFVGLYGTIIDSVLLVLGHFLGYEDVYGTFYQILSKQPASKILIITNCFQFLAMATFNISSEVVLKLGSSVLRGVVNTCRTAVIWIVHLILGTPFSYLSCFGICTIVVGVLAYHYNYFVAVDSWKFDRILRKELTKQKTKDGKTFAAKQKSKEEKTFAAKQKSKEEKTFATKDSA